MTLILYQILFFVLYNKIINSTIAKIKSPSKYAWKILLYRKIYKLYFLKLLEAKKRVFRVNDNYIEQALTRAWFNHQGNRTFILITLSYQHLACISVIVFVDSFASCFL